MNNISDKIANMSPEEYNLAGKRAEQNNPKANRIRNIKNKIRSIVRVARFFGIGDKFTSNSGSVRDYQKGSNYGQTHEPTFRESYKASPLSPEGFNPIDAANLAAYLRSIDGKGDLPEETDCHCDHDDR